MAKLTKDQIIESLREMSLLEVHDLIKAIEEAFDVTAAAPVAVAASSGESAEEKTDFNVLVTSIGGKKVEVIKVVKATLNIGLLDAKKIVDGDVPITIKESVSKDEANDLKEKLEAAGATVELK